MTKKEAAIVSAYTGYLIGSFDAMQQYVDSLLGEPTWTHMYASREFSERVRELAKPDFISMNVEESK